MILAFSITSVMVYATVLLGLGVGIRFFVGRQRFNRRGYGGAQHYSAYWSAILTSTFEGVLMIISALAIVSGTLLLVIELFNSHL
ncbi:hypothetical protein [Dyadobacter chenhuakuii]|uniref:Molybdenum ABC transporter permease n=1 Tax=Dyadobacter chenhuakuii TaxID=2909339 RepID=A0A9X1TZ10_9BACT|nr:hypothetical protein [Dyadobacter chenhuakuii]MCF2496781.1 hypothetical protein [Dyadobacter chenhuakuii]